jgi:hypothetical protein
MGEVVNLRMARKDKARREREKLADANRIAHGRSKAERKQAEAEARIADVRLDAHRLTDEP